MFFQCRHVELTLFEIDALRQLYRPMRTDGIDWTALFDKAGIERLERNVYRLRLNWRSKRIPRIWSGAILNGADPFGGCCARMAVYEFHGVPWCLTVSQENPGKGERSFDFLVSWRVVYPSRYYYDLPLTGDWIAHFEHENHLSVPQDVVEYLTSDRSARMSGAIGPLTGTHLVRGTDGHVYYLIFALAGKRNLFVRLVENDARPAVSETFLVEENVAGYPPYVVGIEDAVERFVSEYGDHLYLQPNRKEMPEYITHE